jgi:ribonucleoside-triphosphate reductase
MEKSNPQWGPIGREVYERTYRRVKPSGEHENWGDTVERVVKGNLALVPVQHVEKDEAKKLKNLLYNFKVIPGGRHLWVSGVEGRQFLFNCFEGKTMVHTDKGIVPIKTLSGSHNVLSQGGVYRSAEFKSYGVRRLYEVEFSSGETLRCTSDHQWIVRERVNPVTTLELKGKTVPINLPTKPERDMDYNEGVKHGIAFGDGTLTHDGKYTQVVLFNEKQELTRYFEEYEVKPYNYAKQDLSTGVATLERHNAVRLSKLPATYKALPTTSSRSYWYGFIVGLVAADGYADTCGGIHLYNKSDDTLEQIKLQANHIGFFTSQVNQHVTTNNLGQAYQSGYRLSFKNAFVDSSELLRSLHLTNFELYRSTTPSRAVIGLTVTNVKPLDVYEEVYCCVEPETHTMTVGTGFLTRQCHRAGWTDDIADHFAFTYDQLMQGGGVGANYSNSYIDRYSPVSNKVNLHIVCRDTHADYNDLQKYLSEVYDPIDPDNSKTLDTKFPTAVFAVPDTREGWVEALVRTLHAYWAGEENELIIDISYVRGKGQPIRGFGGTASGPWALAQMLQDVVKLLNSRTGVNLSTLDMMEIDHLIASCVVAGNVRRSARMSMKYWGDSDIFDFIQCKKSYVSHWSTNISVVIDDAFMEAVNSGDPQAREVYRRCVAGMLTDGEPGFYNLSRAQEGELGDVGCTNPCGEITLEEWENCNLGHVNLDAFYDDPKGAEEAFRLMTRWLVRATFADIPNPVQQEVVNRNRRIGVGMFGYQGWVVKQGVKYSLSHLNHSIRKLLRGFKRICRKTADAYCFQLRIPACIKVTTIAPTGTIAKLPGKSEGIHPIYGRYFKRRIRYADNDPKLVELLQLGYHIEPCQYTANTLVVTFICKDLLVDEVERLGLDADNLVEQANEVSLLEHLSVQAMIQEEYADNAVSFTVNVEDGQYTVDQAMETIIHYLPRIKGTTIMVDASRPQSPYERLTKEEFDQLAHLATIGQGDMECSTGACPVK